MSAQDPNPLIDAYLGACEALVRHFRVRLRSEEDARDLVQDIYIRIADRPVEPIDNPVAYLYRLGTNLMLDKIKQKARSGRRDAAWRESETDALGGEDIAPQSPADEVLAARQSLSLIVEAVRDLPPKAQQAFKLHKLEGLSHAETAAAMGVSRSSVEKYIMTSLQLILRKVGR